MKTTLDSVDIVYGWLSPTVFSNSLSGEVYKHKRPIGSKKEDVVIESLGILNLDLQTSIINVNVHVPDMVITENGATETQADHVRLKALAASIQPYLEKFGSDYNFNIQQQILFEDAEAGEHYINFRIEFYSINILN